RRPYRGHQARPCGPVRLAARLPAVRPSGVPFIFERDWRGGRGVRQRQAKPFTWVQLPSAPSRDICTSRDPGVPLAPADLASTAARRPARVTLLTSATKLKRRHGAVWLKRASADVSPS